VNDVGDIAAALAPGHGKLDLFGYASLDAYGVGLDAEHSLNQWAALYAQAHVGEVDDGTGFKVDAGAIAGVRLHW
jgi:hypothetical protein